MTEPQPWWADITEVLEFGRVLADTEWIDDVEDAFYYLEKPSRFDGEHRVWVERFERVTKDAATPRLHDGRRLWDAFRDEIAEP